jgi:hypothetical protein
MTAEVEILVSEHNNALTVPVETIVQHGGKTQVAVKKSDGGFEWRDVTLGDSNLAAVEVKQGIKPGEHVALDPSQLLSEYERLQVLILPPPSRREVGAEKAKGEAGGNAARKRAAPRSSMSPAMLEKFRNVPPEDRARLKGASQEERDAILKKAGFTDAELRQLSEIRKGRNGPN